VYTFPVSSFFPVHVLATSFALVADAANFCFSAWAFFWASDWARLPLINLTLGLAGAGVLSAPAATQALYRPAYFARAASLK
jgi:hypothetical protein